MGSLIPPFQFRFVLLHFQIYWNGVCLNSCSSKWVFLDLCLLKWVLLLLCLSKWGFSYFVFIEMLILPTQSIHQKNYRTKSLSLLMVWFDFGFLDLISIFLLLFVQDWLCFWNRSWGVGWGSILLSLSSPWFNFGWFFLCLCDFRVLINIQGNT